MVAIVVAGITVCHGATGGDTSRWMVLVMLWQHVEVLVGQTWARDGKNNALMSNMTCQWSWLLMRGREDENDTPTSHCDLVVLVIDEEQGGWGWHANESMWLVGSAGGWQGAGMVRMMHQQVIVTCWWVVDKGWILVVVLYTISKKTQRNKKKKLTLHVVIHSWIDAESTSESSVVATWSPCLLLVWQKISNITYYSCKKMCL